MKTILRASAISSLPVWVSHAEPHRTPNHLALPGCNTPRDAISVCDQPVSAMPTAEPASARYTDARPFSDASDVLASVSRRRSAAAETTCRPISARSYEVTEPIDRVHQSAVFAGSGQRGNDVGQSLLDRNPAKDGVPSCDRGCAHLCGHAVQEDGLAFVAQRLDGSGCLVDRELGMRVGCVG